MLKNINGKKFFKLRFFNILFLVHLHKNIIFEVGGLRASGNNRG